MMNTYPRFLNSFMMHKKILWLNFFYLATNVNMFFYVFFLRTSLGWKFILTLNLFLLHIIGYVVTESVKSHLSNLARAVLLRRHPILLQGPTSAGKTSIIEYLAKRTGHRFMRINNHEHTDLQEYLGTYITDEKGTYMALHLLFLSFSSLFSDASSLSVVLIQ